MNGYKVYYKMHCKINELQCTREKNLQMIQTTGVPYIDHQCNRMNGTMSLTFQGKDKSAREGESISCCTARPFKERKKAQVVTFLFRSPFSSQFPSVDKLFMVDRNILTSCNEKAGMILIIYLYLFFTYFSTRIF